MVWVFNRLTRMMHGFRLSAKWQIDKRRGVNCDNDWVEAEKTMAIRDEDDGISFQANAFDVVSSWLLGGRSAAAVEEEEEEEEQDAANDDARESGRAARASVTLYRPSASAKPSLTGRNNGAAAAGANDGSVVDGKALTNEEKEMRKKLLRKSGSYRTALENEAEDARKAAQDEEEEKEEQELLRYRNEKISLGASTSRSPAATATALTDVNPKKRKAVSAQDELLEKLRGDAARAKAKNQKAKLRLQRKREQERKQKELAAAGDKTEPAVKTEG